MSDGQEKSGQQQIPGYKLVSKLGAGGMGRVYKAVQQSLDREVAIKVMPLKLAANPEYRERFFREAKAAGRLNHSNIVQGIDAGEAGKYCWIAMELVHGESVADLLEERGSFDQDTALSIVMQIAGGLDHAAQAGIVHRDVKPENFLLTKEGVAKLCDLGIAKAETDTGLTQDGRAVGTPRYIAPEQARGDHDIDTRADIYSLGASWYHMLAGDPPFDGPTAAVVMTKHITDHAQPLMQRVKGMNPAAARVIEKMMAKDREKRYQDFGELLEDLEALAAGKPPPHIAGGTKTRTGKRPRGNRPAAEKESKARPTRDASRSARKRARSESSEHHTRRRGHPEKRNSTPLLLLAVGGGVALILFLVFVVPALLREETPRRPQPGGGSPSSPQPTPGQDRPRSGAGTEPGEAAPGGLSVEERRELEARRRWKGLKKDMKDASDLRRISEFESFAEHFEGTEAAAEAREEIQAFERRLREQLLQQATEEWASVVQRLGRAESYRERLGILEEFIRTFPDTPQADEAREMIKGIREEHDLDTDGRALGPLERLEAVAAGTRTAEAEAVTPYLANRHASMRAAALAALDRVDPKAAREAARKKVDDVNEAVRLAAIRVLAEDPTETDRKHLARLAEADVSPVVREAAANAMP